MKKTLAVGVCLCNSVVNMLVVLGQNLMVISTIMYPVFCKSIWCLN